MIIGNSRQKNGGDFINLSILIPCIRTSEWKAIYDSAIHSAGRYSFEIIFVGPFALPENMKQLPNIEYVEDFGSPIRTQQIALTQAEGEYITWFADDGLFLPNAISQVMNLFHKHGLQKKLVISGKYYEAEGPVNAAIHEDPNYYRLNHHKALKSPYFPDSWLIYNNAFIKRDYLLELGGWDCQFEATAMAHSDLAARAQRDGAVTLLSSFVTAKFGHMPKNTGDHGPVYYAQVQNDEPLYRNIYDDKSCRNRIKIDINNWKNSPDKWTRRQF